MEHLPSRPLSQKRTPAEGEENSIVLIFESVKDSVAQQRAQKETLENKASMLIAFAGGMFALLMSARETLITLAAPNRILLLISIVLFAVSVVLCNVVTWIRRYRVDPEPKALAKNYLNMSPKQTRLQIISNTIGTWERNRKLLEDNANILRWAFICQAAAFVLLGIALFLSVL